MSYYLHGLLLLMAVAAGCIASSHGAGESPSNPLRLVPNQIRIQKSKITLSGFSSGGTFAQMMQFCYSSLFQGVAVFSHNFYRCGPPNGVVDDYDRVCTKLFNLTTEQHYNPELVHQDIRTYMQNRQIEDVSNLRNRKLYVYAGLNSIFFTLDQSMGILKVYEPYIQNPKAIRTRVQNANLVLPTNNPFGVPCSELANQRSFIGNCGFSGAHEALSFLLNDNPSHSHDLVEPQPGQKIRLAPLRYFDQSEFSRGVPNANMDSVGLIYIPSSGCVSSKCLLHFYFHGCLVGRELNGTTHIVNSGYLELAELNNIVMVFPQALSSQPSNTIGCWDTFGVGGPLYATQEGAQIRVVKRILDTFIGGGSGGNGGSGGTFVPGQMHQRPPRPPPHSHGHGFGDRREPGLGSFGGAGWSGSNSASKIPQSSFSSAKGSASSGAASSPRGWTALTPSRPTSLVRFPA